MERSDHQPAAGIVPRPGTYQELGARDNHTKITVKRRYNSTLQSKPTKLEGFSLKQLAGQLLHVHNGVHVSGNVKRRACAAPQNLPRG